jgi:hypothetical protein
MTTKFTLVALCVMLSSISSFGFSVDKAVINGVKSYYDSKLMGDKIVANKSTKEEFSFAYFESADDSSDFELASSSFSILNSETNFLFDDFNGDGKQDVFTKVGRIEGVEKWWDYLILEKKGSAYTVSIISNDDLLNGGGSEVCSYFFKASYNGKLSGACNCFTDGDYDGNVYKSTYAEAALDAGKLMVIKNTPFVMEIIETTEMVFKLDTTFMAGKEEYSLKAFTGFDDAGFLPIDTLGEVINLIAGGTLRMELENTTAEDKYEISAKEIFESMQEMNLPVGKSFGRPRVEKVDLKKSEIIVVVFYGNLISNEGTSVRLRVGLNGEMIAND